MKKRAEKLTVRFNRWLENYPDDFGRGLTTAEDHPVKKEKAARPPKPPAPLKSDGSNETVPMMLFRKTYRVFSVLLCSLIIAVLLYTIAELPPSASPDNPYNNEVSERYIEKGLEETGAVNIVAGMILDYRAFDTFGETCVLFAAISCVFILLKSDRDDGLGKEPDIASNFGRDRILSTIAALLVPLILLLGVYVVLNGHLSAGGGFSGGAIIGAGLILYYLAFGYERAESLFSYRTFKIITFTALSFYCLAKSYSFYTGANHIESIIPLGTPGNILSSGLILPLNICVGLVVACTMYAFYAIFRKGGI